jgi:hypothetical protein
MVDLREIKVHTKNVKKGFFEEKEGFCRQTVELTSKEQSCWAYP